MKKQQITYSENTLPITQMNLLVNPIVQIILLPIRQWLESIKVNSYKKAHTLCQLIPASCPFERNITLFKRTVLHIPPLCKLNPFYEQLVELRFKALTYLAECGEDVTIYC